MPSVPRTVLTTRGQQTRERIVDTAAALVYAGGAPTTSLGDVLAASGTSKSQLYHYFDDRDDLLRAVVERQAERVRERHRELLTGVETLSDLHRWATATVVEAEGHGLGGCPLGSLAAQLADQSDELRSDLVRGFAEWQLVLQATVARLQAAGQARTDAAASDLAAALLAALQGGLLLSRTTGSSDPLRIALAMAVDHLAPR